MAGSGNHAVIGRLNKPKEENQKLERQLKMLNKPAIKSFKKRDTNFNTIQAGWHVNFRLLHKINEPDGDIIIPYRSASRALARSTRFGPSRGPWPRIFPVDRPNPSLLLEKHAGLDRFTGNWWLTFGPDGTKIGYWPKELFNWLSEKAKGVVWGGVAGGPKNLQSPPMGSGHFANLGDGKAAYFKQTEMEPSYYPTSAIDKFSSNNKFQNISIGIEHCPEGTVLIRRIRKEELLASQYLTNSFSDVKLHWAYIQTNIKRQKDYYGAKAAINVYGLQEIKSPQSTHAQIWVIGFKRGLEQDFNTVQAGWHVHPRLNGDSQSRLFIHWRDRSTGNWWLTLDGTKIGYWPKALFNWLSEKAQGVIWGGVASAPKNGRTPPMGSGHFANLGDGKAAYFKQAEVIYTPGGGFTPIDPSEQSPYQDAPKCYTVTAPEKVPNMAQKSDIGQRSSSTGYPKKLEELYGVESQEV
ncbi:hypothetical protein QJS04_geneDACA016075 [Acorus gramineus]|uniref:Neprosin PEP catalytic domain-containing protein n=1 Tax=Acorus gramineus TaxID=55184 RepID=A0AAV9BEL1_ACOGR|nr:hypothetical protein QJS04_geneDACA016075 [Acorus gramineus]